MKQFEIRLRAFHNLLRDDNAIRKYRRLTYGRTESYQFSPNRFVFAIQIALIVGFSRHA